MKLTCLKQLENNLEQSYPELCPIAVTAELPPPEMNGDITVNCFRIAGQLKTNPMKLAEEVREHLTEHPDVCSVDVVKAFVNVTLDTAALYRDTIDDMDTLLANVALPEEKRQKVLLEYSAPNTNKPQHLGHVRNNTLGSALRALMLRVGHSVVAVNLINDRGIHICKSMIAYQRFGSNATPESSGKKGDHLIGEMYVKFERQFQREVAAIKREKPRSSGYRSRGIISRYRNRQSRSNNASGLGEQ